MEGVLTRAAAPQTEAPGALRAFYRHAAVRKRLSEYCGAAEGPAFSATGLAGYGGTRRLSEPEGAPVPAPLTDLPRLLSEGADVCRSLADRRGTLFQLDVDYAHPSVATEPYRDSALCFERLEPVYEEVLAAFRSFGVCPLVLMTARGYHFTVRAPFGGPLHAALLGLGGRPDLLVPDPPWSADPESPLMEVAHHTAGKLVEFLCHDVCRRLAGRMQVPVTLADVGPPGGGPFVCLDLSAYGDPLVTRYARCAFSGHQKAWMRGTPGAPGWVVTLPRVHEEPSTLLAIRVDTERAADHARASVARIPDVTGGLRWLEAYRTSALARFHRSFEQGPHAEASLWPYTYDVLPLDRLPACARLPLATPNPYLLMPVYLRTAARVLADQGWHPRSVAELIRSRYAHDHAWGDLWRRYDCASRALFYTRVLLGAHADGLDGGADFTCSSQRARGACAPGGCGFDLERLRLPRRPYP